MQIRPEPLPPGSYELRVAEHLDEHWSTWFGGLTLTHTDDGTTILRGPVTDQAELHGLLAKVRDLGATLLSVQAINADAGLHAVGPPRPGRRRITDPRDPSP